MSDYSTINEDYAMFETKAPVNYYEDIRKQVSINEMVNYMVGILLEYDNCMLAGQDAKTNPMSGRITMRTKNGTLFEIPENIQKFTISKYYELKSRQQNGENINIESELDNKNIVNVNKNNKNIVGVKNIENKLITNNGIIEQTQYEGIGLNKQNNFNRIIIIILILVIIYSLYKYFDENKPFERNRFNY
jgi:hypothetical protein